MMSKPLTPVGCAPENAVPAALTAAMTAMSSHGDLT